MRTLALLLFISGISFAQCTVDGTVVNSTNGAPIERAHVSIMSGTDIFFADSDAAGKWIAEHVACGRVTVVANRPGFLRKQQVIEKSPAHEVRLQLVPQAVLTGRVLDEQGEPLLGAQVSLMTSRLINGVRGTQASTSAVTNDLGEYRFSGLAAGKYILCANSGGGAIAGSGERAYGEKCYPGSMPMEVAAGYEGRNDFMLTPIATARVSGVVSGQPGGERVEVNLVPRSQIARMYLGVSTLAGTDGGFVITRVPPGSYTVHATSGRMVGSVPIEIGSADVNSLHVHVELGTVLMGTVKVVSSTPTKFAGAMDVEFVRNLATDGVGYGRLAEWSPDRTSFRLADVASGNYSVKPLPAPPFYVKSVTLEGRDISNSDFLVAPGIGTIEVVLADDGGAIEGDVSEGSAWVLVQKDGVSSRNARTDASGHFKIDNLPPGDYKVYAWDDNANVEYGNPEWMRQNGKGVAVSVAPGQTAHVAVTRQTAPPI